ncbi:hypothetical protein EYF80_049574 [Liparis tanakae]|uniref:Uncharacterized protein n=1 Tax=Liparis tanakae TaxID=230148 RepID=A0A4Z2FH71_9TELE|nr:hypothetical protein EYF80_049574 [Liparis tanakae]
MAVPPSYLSSLGPDSGLMPAKPGMLRWSLMIMMSPTLKSWLRPPAALVSTTVSTPSSLKMRMGSLKATWSFSMSASPPSPEPHTMPTVGRTSVWVISQSAVA